MIERKKAIHANEKSVASFPRIAEVVDGTQGDRFSLAEILEKAELDVHFIPPVSIHSVGSVMENYDGRIVCIEEAGKLGERILHHGKLEFDVMSDLKYSLRSEENPRQVDKYYFSKVRRFIVVRGYG